MTNYLVTGGAGFIGSHIVDELLRRGETVRVLDDFSTGKRENLAQKPVELIEGDLTDLKVVRQALEGVDYVLHLGAIPSVPRSVTDPLASNAANVIGTLNVLEAARFESIKRIVYSSSSSIYGSKPVHLLPLKEDLPTNPLSPYAVSKLAGEGYCRVFHQVYGLSTVCLRYFNVFGPRQDSESLYAAVIPKFITCMLKEESPTVYGDGLQSRDFTYVANVVEANLLACQSDCVDGQVINVATGGRMDLLGLIRELNTILGTNLVPKFEDSRQGDVKHSLADITRMRLLLGFLPTVDFYDGLRRTVAWLAQ